MRHDPLARRYIVVDDPENEPEADPYMEFRLTYAGPLHATQRNDRQHMANKHQMRQAFHRQLRELWTVLPALNGLKHHKRPQYLLATTGLEEAEPPTSADDLAKKFALYGHNFVPLVTEELDLILGIEVLFLRPGDPGAVVWAGDIDNRLKTLLDALRIPQSAEDYVNRTPDPDETPMYVLMEDDKLITKVAVETDRLLEPIGPTMQPHDTRLIITVRVRPYEPHLYNRHLG